jgi:hypothetical protein
VFDPGGYEGAKRAAPSSLKNLGYAIALVSANSPFRSLGAPFANGVDNFNLALLVQRGCCARVIAATCSAHRSSPSRISFA